MKRRQLIQLVAAAVAGAVLASDLNGADALSSAAGNKLAGMYVHEGWVYNRPYASRAWTWEDWHGYLDGLHRLGFNLVSIWPMLETMPNPLAPSDKAVLDKMRHVIDAAHKEFGMKVWIVLCPNIMPVDEHARRLRFEKRRYFGADVRVNPADSKAMDAMMAWREQLLRPLAEMDGGGVIDSDPGGYPGSTNREFVDLLMRHRRLFDKLRPRAIELIYWAWTGWPTYARYYSTGDFAWGTKEEFLEAFTLLNAQNPEPWGLARGLEYAEQLGLQARVINLNYGAIEGEPTFPMTNFGGTAAYDAGRNMAPRGAMANAQTHCVQLPNTFAFAQGAKGLPLNDKAYIQFANDLILGRGELIFAGWQALGGTDSGRMRHVAKQLAPLANAKLEAGPLKGLLFGDAHRFVKDVELMLRAKAACLDFINDSKHRRAVFASYTECVNALERWQLTTGYESHWNWTGIDLNPSLHRLNSPALESEFRERSEGNTPMDRVTAENYRMESQTLRIIRAMRQTLLEMVR
jgi:hypothetical protein